mgnify:FL=1
MNIETIRYFEEVARAESFYGAAKRLAVSQQGLNKAITALERELSVKLFERSRKGVALTPTGKSFLAFAQKVTADYADFLDALYDPEEERSAASDPFLIYVTHYSAQIASATQAYVDLLAQCSYFEEPFEKIVSRACLSDGTDLGFVDLHANSALDLVASDEVAFDPVLRTQLGIVCREGSAFAQRESVRRREIGNAPCAADASREAAAHIEWLFRDYPIGNLQMSVASPRMLIRFVHSRGDAVALYDSFSFHLALKDPAMPTDGLAFVPLSTPEATSYVGFLYPKHTKQRPRVRHAANLLDRYLQEHQADYLEEYPV